MITETATRILLLLLSLAAISPVSSADEIRLLNRARDPFGYPRPARGETGVPVGTSLFFQLGFSERDSADRVLPDSVTVSIAPEGGETVEIVSRGQHFARGYSGKIAAARKPESGLAVYIDREDDLQPLTKYSVAVRAESRDGGVLRGRAGSWQFTTAPGTAARNVTFTLDLTARPVHWRGGFFTGFCKPSFCTSASNRIEGYELMREMRQDSPRAWSLQRDFRLTGMQHQPKFLDGAQPNLVRERETRRIVAMKRTAEAVLLRVEDFFGHEQYGIPSGRSLADDYCIGDEILIADGIRDARAEVLQVVADTASERTLRVTAFEAPPDGWKIAYAGPLPETEDPSAPGWFPPGGCYLRKFRPAGTPRYYWGRVDREWDIAQRRFGRRLVVNFADAPGDLSVDGRGWTYPKDYVQYHQVVRDITSHLIERYGDACLEFFWSVLNEPDLASAFWRSGDWGELQKFYDYTVDAVLRSFEDHGYDSQRVMVGGLEIGAIFGVHIEQPILRKFLCHCSPQATCEGALDWNAAFADSRLDGKRSRRVEKLCRSNEGQGSPCDFLSVHCYNAAPLAAAKLQRAKELALEVDAGYFADVWITCFESCPDWAPPPDVAAADSYLGNGYFSTWCADVTRRQLSAAADDPRYGFGESVLTFWPWPNRNLGGHNNATQVLAVDKDGDGEKDDEETVALPILRFLGLLAEMGDHYWVLPERQIGNHVVSGIASRDDERLQVLVYAHDPLDVQSRSESEFPVRLQIRAAPWSQVHTTEYRFDKDHNSYFRLGRALRERQTRGDGVSAPSEEQVEKLLAGLASDDPQIQLETVKRAATYKADLPESVLVAAMRLFERTPDETVRSAIVEAGKKIVSRSAVFSPAEVARIRAQSKRSVTRRSVQASNSEGALELTLTVSANGANFAVVRPAGEQE